MFDCQAHNKLNFMLNHPKVLLCGSTRKRVTSISTHPFALHLGRPPPRKPLIILRTRISEFLRQPNPAAQIGLTFLFFGHYHLPSTSPLIITMSSPPDLPFFKFLFFFFFYPSAPRFIPPLCLYKYPFPTSPIIPPSSHIIPLLAICKMVPPCIRIHKLIYITKTH